jgi:hypothetical protein
MDASTKDTLEVAYWCFSTAVLIATIIFIYMAPLKAVRLSKSLENISGKENAKRRLFYTLFAYRGLTTEPEYINGLNTIDIIFQDEDKVISSWHKLRDSFRQKDLIDAVMVRELLKTDLLSNMAQSLGYAALNQIDVMNYYTPQIHGDQQQFQSNFEKASYNFHLYGSEVYRMLLDKEKITQEVQTQEEKQS